jgi:D-glycero-D-manno-heptose 1,7-bisphosphate phosphatase
MMAKGCRPAVFFDRDGTIIHDVGYPKDPGQVQLLPGAGEALADLKKRGFALVLISNQSGIGRGLVTEREAEHVHQQVVSSLAQYSVQLDAAYYCPHAPAQRCCCRKPSPSMLLQAAGKCALDLACSFMVGDKPIDIEAGKRVGCRTILLAASPIHVGSDPVPDDVATDWSEVWQHILRHSRQQEAGRGQTDGAP